MATLFQATGGVTSLLPTTTWSDPGSLFPTTDRNDSNAYGWAPTTSTLTLPSSGLANGYLFLWGFEFEDTSNGRHNPQARIVQASGTGNFASASTGGYNRDNSEDRAYVSGWSFVDSPSPSSTFQFQWRRDSDVPTGGTVRSFIQAVPVYYSDAGVYTSSSTSAPGGTTPNQITGFTGTDGTNISLSSDTVSVTGDNKRYLVLGSAYHQGIGNARTQRWYGLRIDGVKDDAAKAAMYYRNSANADGGSSFSRLLETGSATRTVDLFQYLGDGVAAGQGGADVPGNVTGSNSSHSLVILELNDSAEVFSSIDAEGGQEFALAGPVDVDVASIGDIEFSDSSSFTRSTDTSVNIEQNMDVLAFANVSHARGASSIGSGSRWTVHGEFTINGVEQTSVGFHGNYNRGNQGSQDTHGSSTNQAGFFALSTGDDFGVSNQELAGTEGGGGDIESQPGWVGFGLINLDSLGGAGADTNVEAGSASISLGSHAGSVSFDRLVEAGPLIMGIPWNRASVYLDRTLVANTQGLSLTAHRASVSQGTTVSAKSVPISLTSHQTQTRFDVVVQSLPSLIGLSPLRGTVQLDTVVQTGTTGISFSSHTASVASGGDTTIEVGSTLVSLQTYPASLEIFKSIKPTIRDGKIHPRELVKEALQNNSGTRVGVPNFSGSITSSEIRIDT